MKLCFETVRDSSNSENIIVFEQGRFEQPIIVLDEHAIIKILAKLKNNKDMLNHINSVYSDITIEFKE